MWEDKVRPRINPKKNYYRIKMTSEKLYGILTLILTLIILFFPLMKIILEGFSGIGMYILGWFEGLIWFACLNKWTKLRKENKEEEKLFSEDKKK